LFAGRGVAPEQRDTLVKISADFFEARMASRREHARMLGELNRRILQSVKDGAALLNHSKLAVCQSGQDNRPQS